MNYFAEIKQQIATHNLPAEGCTEVEITSLEATLSRQLPAAYKEFLSIIGRNTAGLLCGNEVEYDYLIEMQLEAHEISSRNGGPLLTSTDFVFLIHQNYSFYVFRLSENDDPDIFLFIEGGEEFESWRPRGKFSEFVLHMFREHLQGAIKKGRPAPFDTAQKAQLEVMSQNDSSLFVYSWAFLGAGLLLFALWELFQTP